ncbi:MAG: hypothetical protein GX821_04895 [Clostridiaceae bacterium]|jgi:hypothetical protein|nr:hypothetical protein [Clostridiaceae bacterium]
MDKLTALHVMPLLPGHEADLAADAFDLIRSGVATDCACMMTLVPEGNPPQNKAKILGDRFLAFRDAYPGDTAHLGILAQATIGHGYVPDEPASFQQIVRPDGSLAYQMCPFDPAFQHYIREAIGHLASLRPAFIMIDDDFRLLTGRNGCFCPLHLAETGRRLGRSLSRTELIGLLSDETVARLYDNVLLDSLLQLAGVIRDAMDETDPALPGSFCTCYGDVRHAGAIAGRLAGKGQPRVVRINNARYLNPEMRSFPVRMYHGTVQIAALDDDILVLAETDTCPQNRYSTAAALLHAHYTGSILEGCHGAKHWITRTRAYQPASGAAYRAVLGRYQQFYETLFQAVQASRPDGYAASALPSASFFNAAPVHGDRGGSEKTWGALLGVLGLPCNYARMPDLPVMLTGEDVGLFSDTDLRQLAAGGMLLEGAAAVKLCARGFAAAIGVNAVPYQGPRVSAERWGQKILGSDSTYAHLEPLGPKTRVQAILLHRKSGVDESFTEMGPAATLFTNDSGGRVVVLAASVGTSNKLSSFGFYDADRKLQLLELLSFICGRPVAFHYPGDAEIYLKLRRFPDGRYLLALFNLGHDPLDTIPLASPLAISRVEQIAPDGQWVPVALESGALLASLAPAEPKVFRVTAKDR